MKKIIIFGVSVGILIQPFLSTKHILANPQHMLQVELREHFKNKAEISFQLFGSYQLLENPQVVLKEHTPYLIRSVGSSVFLYENQQLLFSGTSLTVKPLQFNETHYSSLNNYTYMGTVKISSNAGFLHIINHVPLEQYLKGVVPKEMPASWNEEALKAQAIAARTYAYARKNQLINDTVYYQAYGGYQPTTYYPKISKVVEETRDALLMYNGTPISALFSSSNGGFIESNANMWGTTELPYLKAKKDPFDPVNTWKVSLKKVQINMDQLDKRNPQFWWDTVTELPEDKTELFSAKQWLYQKPEFKNKEIKIIGIPDVSIHAAKNSSGRSVRGDVSFQVIEKNTLNHTYVMNASGEIHQKTVSYTNLPLDTIRAIFNGNLFKSHLITHVDQSTPGTITIEGAGFGHGVGMSQYGANSMAAKGYTFQQILNFYYPGAALVSSEGNPVSSPDSSSTDPYYDSGIVKSTSSLPVRSAPSASFPIIGNLPSGAKVTILEYGVGWTKIQFNSSSGWVSSLSLSISPSLISQNVPTVFPYLLSLKEKVRLYAIPSFSQPTAHSLAPQTVHAIQKINDWYLVQTGAGPLWLHSVNVTAQTPPPEVPVEPFVHKVFLNERSRLFLHADVNAPSPHYLNPQMIEVFEKKGDWYHIYTSAGPLWILSGNTSLILETPPGTLPFSKKLTLLERIRLFSSATLNAPTSLYLDPQTVQAFERSGDWYHIYTGMGPLWLHSTKVTENVPVPFQQQLPLLTRSRLYASPSEWMPSNYFLDPQTVQATEKMGDWYRIQTGVGPYWIHQVSPSSFSAAPFHEKVTFFDRIRLYAHHSFQNPTAHYLNAQTVQAFEKLGDWYHIYTSIGPFWINPDNELHGTITPQLQTISLTKRTRLYQQPDLSKPTIHLLDPQQVFSFEYIGSWHHIYTSAGPLWVTTQ